MPSRSEHVALFTRMEICPQRASAQPPRAEELFDCAEARCGQISILVNNATCSLRDGIETLSPEHIDQHYVVNVRAMAFVCAEFWRHFPAIRTQGVHGRIVDLSVGTRTRADAG